MDRGAHVTGSVRDAGTSWTPIRKSVRWTTTQSAVTLWAPTSGSRIWVTDYIIAVGTACKVTVFAETDTDANLIVEVDAGTNGGASMPHLRTPALVDGGGVIKLTTNGGTGSVTLYGYEETRNLNT